jgi:ketosteroid isomerase-like protein
MNEVLLDRLAIVEVVENWVLYSDSGDWERFAKVWHDDAWMTSTWFQGPAVEFQKARRAGFERGVNIIHFLGGTTVEIRGDRAIAQTKMTINQRAAVDGVVVDAVCTGRFYDFFAKRAARWAIVRRQPIYEKDRLDAVEPGAELSLDPALLARFPEGYRHLGYLQTKAGFNVRLGLPGLRGPELAKLYTEGAAWLDGSPQPGVPL